MNGLEKLRMKIKYRYIFILIFVNFDRVEFNILGEIKWNIILGF